MKLEVRDKAVFDTLSYIDVKAHLQAQGWKETRRLGDRALFFSLTEGDQHFEVCLPLRRNLGDYGARMAETVRILAEAEGNSALSILKELATAGADVIRIRCQSSEQDGSIPIGDGATLVDEARNLLFTAATAAIAPRAIFQGRRPNEASEYMRRVRLGQSEIGSYVITLLSPVAPALQSMAQKSPDLAIAEEPYERVVTTTLATSLAAVKSALSTFATTGDFKPFEESIPFGVSANLCESIVGLVDAGSNIDISVSWASVRPGPNGPSHVFFAKDDSRVLAEVARTFRSQEPRLDQVIFGFVVGLQRGPDADEGEATIAALVDERPRQLIGSFGPELYRLVAKANVERLSITCEGDLYPKGKVIELRNPRKMTVLGPAE